MSEAKISLPAFYGIKAGMTRIFDQNGNHVPVTVVKLIPNVISQVKTTEKDGYTAYQVAYNEKRESLVTSPVKVISRKLILKRLSLNVLKLKFQTLQQMLLEKKLHLISSQLAHT